MSATVEHLRQQIEHERLKMRKFHEEVIYL